MAHLNDLHIEDFCKDTAKIWVMLYQSFPNTITLYIEDIIGPDTPDEFGLHSPRHNACFNTVLWLAQAGYIFYQDTLQQEAFEQITLTHKAFTFLASPDDAISDATALAFQPRILTLRDTLQNASSVSLAKQVIAFMKSANDYC